MKTKTNSERTGKPFSIRLKYPDTIEVRKISEQFELKKATVVRLAVQFALQEGFAGDLRNYILDQEKI